MHTQGAVGLTVSNSVALLWQHLACETLEDSYLCPSCQRGITVPAASVGRPLQQRGLTLRSFLHSSWSRCNPECDQAKKERYECSRIIEQIKTLSLEERRDEKDTPEKQAEDKKSLRRLGGVFGRKQG